ncbi:exosortase-associated protein EpsI, B-type [Roseateles koreensis]|uniref:EpsI family protein n=1 Tax=Roseateles koreensis TaxID=2987526 RepID=A0ABT5KUT8_9BURK|nr:exosortase-associated protein EpsI, B-type [Roseateles koreensis]MDC8786699.1 EpsI family protein [Roseateles koreensis]
MASNLFKASILSALMVGAYFLSLAITPRTYLADVHAREKLAAIVPNQFGDWRVDDSVVPIPPSPDLQKVIDATYDETLAMTFKNAAGVRMMLSLAYGRNQHKGMLSHRPEICYPAQGFKLTSAVEDAVLPVDGRALNVKHMVATMGPRNEPITYWVMVGDEMTEFGYPHRWVAIRYGMQGKIPDGVLVRVSSIDANNSEAFAMQSGFLKELLDAMPAEKRSRLIGLH